MSNIATLDDLKTRDKILSTAFGLFLQKGYDKTPVQAIIDAVGIAKGTFYHHFDSKDEMLVSLVNGMTDQILDVIKPIAADPALGVMEKIVTISRTAAAMKADTMGPEMLVVVRQMRSQANRPLAECLNSILQKKIKPLFNPVLLQGVKEGLFKLKHPEWAADLVLNTIMSFQDPIIDCFIRALETSDNAVFEATMDTLTEIYEAMEESLERQLGAAPGSFPIYSSINIRGVLASLFPGGKP